MELNILKIDLDEKCYRKAFNQIRHRLCYMNDLSFFDIEIIEKIELQRKTSFGCKIYLKENLPSEKDVIMFQLLFGSDYMKEVNTILNHFKFKMEYSNRLFDCKRYKGGKIKSAKKFNVTEEIIDFVKDEKRKKSYN
ncbi:MAG: hypothetical protein ACOC1P_00350 [Minisyncoccales bacterium]